MNVHDSIAHWNLWNLFPIQSLFSSESLYAPRRPSPREGVDVVPFKLDFFSSSGSGFDSALLGFTKEFSNTSLGFTKVFFDFTKRFFFLESVVLGLTKEAILFLCKFLSFEVVLDSSLRKSVGFEGFTNFDLGVSSSLFSSSSVIKIIPI